MIPWHFIAALLLVLAFACIFAVTVNIEEDEPLYPAGEPRLSLALGLAAIIAAFIAGLLL